MRRTNNDEQAKFTVMPRPFSLHSCNERLQAKEIQCKRVKRMEHAPKTRVRMLHDCEKGHATL